MAPIDRVVTSGTFSLDGGTWDVENNVWLVGDADEVLIVDAAHDARAIADAVAGRRVVGIVCTHAHDDHVDAAPSLAEQVAAPVFLHPADRVLWDMRHPAVRPDRPIDDGQRFRAGGVELVALHTPGHSPGSVCLYAPELATVFTGDTLFQGGPGATGRSFSDRDEILRSIRGRLLSLPGDTVVRTGHGDTTTVAAESERLSG
jgi:glyoxylase-like metal-dependent hydrolase (beta-lactamase superfamily II)